MLLVLCMVLFPLGELVKLHLSYSPAAVLVGYIATLVMFLVVPVDGMLLARKNRTPPVTKWNKAWIYITYPLLVWALILWEGPWLQRQLWLREFRIPTGAMIPTILIGDQVVVDMSSGIENTLERGDIVVFEDPRDGELYLKRVVGLGGEVLEIREKVVHIDGTPVEEPYKIHQTEYGPEAWIRVTEGLPVETTRSTAFPIRRDIFDLEPVLIPEDSVFLLGDNRDNSKDSRSFGSLPRRRIVGRVIAVRWSRSETQGIRWHRIGWRPDGDM